MRERVENHQEKEMARYREHDALTAQLRDTTAPTPMALRRRAADLIDRLMRERRSIDDERAALLAACERAVSAAAVVIEYAAANPVVTWPEKRRLHCPLCLTSFTVVSPDRIDRAMARLGWHNKRCTWRRACEWVNTQNERRAAGLRHELDSTLESAVAT